MKTLGREPNISSRALDTMYRQFARSHYKEPLTGISMKCAVQNSVAWSLDLDFADVTRFPPEKTGGIAVIRVPRNPTLPLLERLVRQFLHLVEQMSVEKKAVDS